MSQLTEKEPIILPVRRVLMVATMAYILGIFLAVWFTFPSVLIGCLGVCFALWGVVRLRQRKHALFCVLICLFLLGNGRAGSALRIQEGLTPTNTLIEGRVTKVLSDNRICLKDVRVGEEKMPSGNVAVTLLTDAQSDEEVDIPRVGQRVFGKGRLYAVQTVRNPGESNSLVYALCGGYVRSGYLLSGWTTEGKATFSLREMFKQIRGVLRDRIQQLFGEDAGLYTAIMLGDRSDVDETIGTAMRLTGTAHLLTVSGLHLNLLAGAVCALLDRFALRRRLRFGLLSVILLFFTGLTGGAAGTVRACIMLMIQNYALVRGKKYDPLTALSVAALGMTMVRPVWVLHPSFQFSFFVVLGIQLFSETLSNGLKKHVPDNQLLYAVLNALTVSLCAQIASLPMQLMLYGYIPLLSLPINLLCGVLMPILLLGGWIVTGLGAVFPAGGTWLAGVFSTITDPLHVASTFDWQKMILRAPAPGGILVLLFATGLLLASRRIRYGRWRFQTLGIVSVLVVAGYLMRFNPQARYVQLDVGQGDGAVLRSGRHAVLIDTGPKNSDALLRYVRHEGLQVDALILSHTDADHAGALEKLMKSEVQIPVVILPPLDASDDIFQKLEAWDVQIKTVKRGERIAFADGYLDVLAPEGITLDSNASSLMLLAQLKGVRLMLTGDVPGDCEPEYVPPADVLKVAHHGSKNSTTEAFLRQVQPKLALISAGEGNRYGHPHGEVLERLKENDTEVRRTDEEGCITLWLKKGTYRVNTQITKSKDSSYL